MLSPNTVSAVSKITVGSSLDFGTHSKESAYDLKWFLLRASVPDLRVLGLRL